MSFEALVLLAGALFILAATPGPGVMLVVARTMTSGLKHAFITVLGIVTADIIFLLLVVYGLQAIAESLGIVFTIIKYVGGAYLIWLGISIWRSKPQQKLTKLQQQEKKSSYSSSWVAGIIIALSNPKAILFYMSFLPAFVDIPSLTTVDIFIVSVIVCLVIGGVMFFGSPS